MVKDWAYLAGLKPDEVPPLQAMIKYVRETHDTRPIEQFNQGLEDRIKAGDPSVTKSEDIMTTVGLQECIKLMVNASTTRWRYMGVGTGTTAAAIANTALATEGGTRQDMSVNGWREAIGMKLAFGAIWPELAGMNSIKEIGIFNAASGPSMMNREVFANNSLSRTAGRNVFILSVVVEFCPIA